MQRHRYKEKNSYSFFFFLNQIIRLIFASKQVLKETVNNTIEEAQELYILSFFIVELEAKDKTLLKF